MEIVTLCVIYLLECFCYQLGLRILFNTKVKRSGWIIVGISIPILMGVSSVYVLGKLVIITLSVLILNLLLTKGKVTEKIFQNTMILVLISCLDDILETTGLKTGNINRDYLYVRLLVSLLLVVVFHVSKSIQIPRRVHISSLAYFVIGLAAVSMMSGLAFLDYVMCFLENTNFTVIFNLLDIVVYINVILLVLFVVHIQRTNAQIEELLKSEKILKTMQKNYYCRLLESENETRKYRHDMNNHFYYIQTLLESGKAKEAKDYFSKLQRNFQNSQVRNYVTGNEMIDVIMNYFFEALPDNVQVEIEGRCPVKLAMEDVDICTIFSNLFQNVLEAVTEDTKEKRKVNVFVKKGSIFAEYRIENTFLEGSVREVSIDASLPATRKQDEKNHGVGLRNVRETVQKNGGKFSWEIIEGRFCIKIILPILTV